MQVGDLSTVKENSFKVLPKGNYTMQIVLAEEAIAKSSGNEMLKMELMYDEEGVKLFENLANVEKMKWKFKHLTEATNIVLVDGLLNPADLLGKYVDVKVGIKKDDMGDDRNFIADYIVPKEKPVEVPAKSDDSVL
jgi:hypothetical protein